ncbi:MAG TPA: 1-deoxy-D-xylulose-5-phosphate reductoisomerase [Bacillota bacterium]|nr:1-deoxy-D-xylulose-5-phosphate reductoisomerase [Bacillota bacterium]HPT87099.1 1-deoxy-D-xylulose-5-phosphate reductoisomerase [Bacillota bacterium]
MFLQKKIAILGSTGSIGKQTLEVIQQFPDEFSVVALAAGSQLELLVEQVKQFKPKYVAIGDVNLVDTLRTSLAGLDVAVLGGTQGLVELATLPEADIVVSAVVGAVGIEPTMAAVRAGKRIALANKETLVAAGSIIMPSLEKYQAELIPVDSEHSAIFQCLEGRNTRDVARIILTASGGPFRNYQPELLENVSVADALKHPNWNMGGKITIDSATMFNKGLEIIEAHWLFDMPYERIKVVIHPESIIHSMVELTDGSVMAQLGLCDMKLPIQLALTYPERRGTTFPKLDVIQQMQLRFQPVDDRLFPAVELAYQAGKIGGSLPAAINAANEMAVAAFLQGRIKFTRIIGIVSEVFGYHQKESFSKTPDLQEILAVDAWARERARELLS